MSRATQEVAVTMPSRSRMAEQVIVKENLWNQQRIDTVKATLDAIGGGFQFMPIIADDAVHDAAFAEHVGKAFAPGAIELINWRAGAQTLTENGGPLFSARMRAVSVRGGLAAIGGSGRRAGTMTG